MASRALEAAVRAEEETRAVREEALGVIDSAQETVWRLEERAERAMEEALAGERGGTRIRQVIDPRGREGEGGVILTHEHEEK